MTKKEKEILKNYLEDNYKALKKHEEDGKEYPFLYGFAMSTITSTIDKLNE